MMQVKLVSHTPDPVRAVAMAARLCYSPVGAEELAQTMSDRQAARLVERVRELGHLSTFEHASFTFAIEGVSRALTHQLVRHRLASYSQQSQRYVEERAFEYIIPPSVAANPQAEERFRRLMEEIRKTYAELVTLGIPREDARYCLANATETKILVTMNARELLHFFRVRCCMRAQWEIRSLAEAMLREVRQKAPELFAKAGPACIVDGRCSEGEMSCGRIRPPAASGQGSKTPDD